MDRVRAARRRRADPFGARDDAAESAGHAVLGDRADAGLSRGRAAPRAAAGPTRPIAPPCEAAVLRRPGRTVRHPRRRRKAVLDPFSVYQKGEALLRRQLSALAGWHLVNIIRKYELSGEDPDAARRRASRASSSRRSSTACASPRGTRNAPFRRPRRSSQGRRSSPTFGLSCRSMRLDIRRLAAVLAASSSLLAVPVASSGARPREDRRHVTNGTSPTSIRPTTRGGRRRTRSCQRSYPRSTPSRARWRTSPARLADALDAANRVAKDFQRVYLYASLISDQDTRVSKYQGMQQEMQQVGATFGETLSLRRARDPEDRQGDARQVDGRGAAAQGLHALPRRHPAAARRTR